MVHDGYGSADHGADHGRLDYRQHQLAVDYLHQHSGRHFFRCSYLAFTAQARVGNSQAPGRQGWPVPVGAGYWRSANPARQG